MLTTLKRHADSHGDAVDRIEVELNRPRADTLELRYVVTGAVAGLHIPPPAAPERTDELWKQSCFETFLRNRSEQGYLEFNLSPSTQWAAYRFDSYRNGMQPNDVPAPRIEIHASSDRFELLATLSLPELREPAHVALAAIVEEADGRKSWWALAHPPGKPDFHHPDCFVLELPPPSGA